MAFVHLHVHSYFSFYDGTASAEQLVERAAELGMPAIVLTDYDGVYGAVRFVKAARSAGIKPIIGAEVVFRAWEDSFFSLVLPKATPISAQCSLMRQRKIHGTHW